MARVHAALVVLVLIVASCDAASLLRFINTVPTRTPQTSRLALATTQPNQSDRDVSVSATQTAIDRVGLLYTIASGPAQGATTVWTEPRAELDSKITSGATPYSWIFGMPPLRAYHASIGTTSSTVESSQVDTVAQYIAAGATLTGNALLDPTLDDVYTQSQLKADGVGLYLTFAAGTYSLSAYGVRGDTTISGTTYSAYNNAAQTFANSNKAFTFVDNCVYTLIAVGTGNYGTPNGAATGSFGDSSSVSLVLLLEDTSSATFGMSTVRFVHAIQSQASASINIQDTLLGNTIVTGLSFGTASSYMDLTPRQKHDFVVVRSDASTIPIAPTDGLTNGASFDLRQGLRATVICANTDLQNPTVFCRMIPSRVVAYVRLVNDNLGNANSVQSTLGSQKMQDAKLTLWASYNLPLPAQVQEGAQVLGASCVRNTNTPLLSKGLYPVVVDVVSSSVSAYGEVHVPVFIMDYAVRPIIRETIQGSAIGATLTNGYNSNPGVNDNPQDEFTDQLSGPPSTYKPNALNWFSHAPVFKRVSFILKTDGFSTLTAQGDASTISVGETRTAPYFTRNLNDANSAVERSLINFLLIAEYMEPGEAYTLVSFPVTDTTNTAYSFLQRSTHSGVQWRRDLTIPMVSQGLATSQGAVRFIPLPSQDWSAVSVSISTRSSLFGPFTNTFITAQNGNVLGLTNGVAGGASNAKQLWKDPVATESASFVAGTYTYSTIGGTTACTKTIPAGTFNIVAGQRVDIFALNTYACLSTSATALNTVQVTPSLFVMPTTVCNPAVTSSFNGVISSSAVAVAPSSVLVMLAVALIAAIAGMF